MEVNTSGVKDLVNKSRKRTGVSLLTEGLSDWQNRQLQRYKVTWANTTCTSVRAVGTSITSWRLLTPVRTSRNMLEPFDDSTNIFEPSKSPLKSVKVCCNQLELIVASQRRLKPEQTRSQWEPVSSQNWLESVPLWNRQKQQAYVGNSWDQYNSGRTSSPWNQLNQVVAKIRWNQDTWAPSSQMGPVGPS